MLGCGRQAGCLCAFLMNLVLFGSVGCMCLPVGLTTANGAATLLLITVGCACYQACVVVSVQNIIPLLICGSVGRIARQ